MSTERKNKENPHFPQRIIEQDSNEKRPFTFDENSFYPRKRRLPIGDYDNGSIIIERKAVPDLAQCLKTTGGAWERLKSEVIRHIESPEGKPLFIIVEGTREAVLSHPSCPPRDIAEDRLNWLDGYAGKVFYCRDRTEAEKLAAEYLWHTAGSCVEVEEMPDFKPDRNLFLVSGLARDLLSCLSIPEENAVSVLAAIASHGDMTNRAVYPSDSRIKLLTSYSIGTIKKAKRLLYRTEKPLLKKTGKKRGRTYYVKQRSTGHDFAFPVWVFKDGLFRFIKDKGEQRILIRAWFFDGVVPDDAIEDGAFWRGELRGKAIGKHEARFIPYASWKKYSDSRKEALSRLKKRGLAYEATEVLRGAGNGFVLVLSPNVLPPGFLEWRNSTFKREWKKQKADQAKEDGMKQKVFASRRDSQ